MPKAKSEPPIFIDHRKIARAMGVSPSAITRWVQKGAFPLPHFFIATLYFYRREQIDYFFKKGRWPPGTKFQGMEVPDSQ